MVIERINEDGKRITICTALEFTDLLARKILLQNMLRATEPGTRFGDIDFCFAYRYKGKEITEDVQLDDLEMCSWFGIKSVKGFNSFQLDLICDYYGGGSIALVSIYEDDRYEDIYNKIWDIIYDAVSGTLGNLNPEEYLCIENL